MVGSITSTAATTDQKPQSGSHYKSENPTHSFLLEKLLLPLHDSQDQPGSSKWESSGLDLFTKFSSSTDHYKRRNLEQVKQGRDSPGSLLELEQQLADSPTSSQLQHQRPSIAQQLENKQQDFNSNTFFEWLQPRRIQQLQDKQQLIGSNTVYPQLQPRRVKQLENKQQQWRHLENTKQKLDDTPQVTDDLQMLGQPSDYSRVQPDYQPRVQPEYQPRLQPEYQPRVQPDYQPRVQPEYQPRVQPEYQSRIQPEYQPRFQPEYQPIGHPEYQPMGQPEYLPISQPNYQARFQPEVVILNAINMFEIIFHKHKKVKRNG